MSKLKEFPRYIQKPTHPQWDIFGSSFSTYMGDFWRVDPENKLPKLLKPLIEHEKPVIIDLMSSTDALRSIYQKRFRPIQGIAVGLKGEVNENIRQEDLRRGITYVEGNLTETETWTRLKEKLNGAKAHLIMERAMGGLHFIPSNQRFYRVTLARIWDMLEPQNGVLLLQTPPKNVLLNHGLPINEWLQLLHREGIYHQFVPAYESKDGGFDNTYADTRTPCKGIDYGLLFLVKTPDTTTLPDLYRSSVAA